MTRNERTEYIDKVVVIGYSWLSEENYQCPLTIYNLLTQLDLNKKEKERVEGLKSDTLAVCKNKEILKNIPEIKIPTPCQTQEDKLLWIIITTIMNLFNSGNFEMGYMFLMEFADSWRDVYINVIPLLRGCDFKEEIIDWAMTHFFFAQDITGKDEFNRLGYKIVKD